MKNIKSTSRSGKSNNAGITPTWKEFKKHFTNARKAIEEGTKTTGKFNMANQVANMSAEIEQTNQQNQTISSALTEALKAITLLQKEVETLKTQKSTTAKTGNTKDTKPNPKKRYHTRGTDWSANDLPKNGEQSKRRFPGSDTYCWSCGYNVAPNHHPCRWKKARHQEDATRDDIKGGSTRNLFHWTRDGN